VDGYAVGYYGYPRATADIDVWIAMDLDNAKSLVLVLKDFGFDVPELTAGLFLEPERIIRMGVPPIRLEITTTISGVDFETCYARRVVDILDGVEVNLISLSDLKVNKMASGRHKDLDDLEHLPE
jgi:hypothetical protein